MGIKLFKEIVPGKKNDIILESTAKKTLESKLNGEKNATYTWVLRIKELIENGTYESYTLLYEEERKLLDFFESKYGLNL